MLQREGFALDANTWCELNRPDITEDEADVVIFGIPFDGGVSYRGGAAEAGAACFSRAPGACRPGACNAGGGCNCRGGKAGKAQGAQEIGEGASDKIGSGV